MWGFSLLILLTLNSAQAGKYSLVQADLDKRSDCSALSTEIYFCGTGIHKSRLQSWLEEIRATAVGRETLTGMNVSGNRLLIKHNSISVLTAGRTLSPLTKNLDNGVGEDVLVEMNLDIPDSGSHLVNDFQGNLISFTAVVNFFHELSHARHTMAGTLLLFRREEQAVQDENLFRQERGQLLNLDYALRSNSRRDDDEQIWFPPNGLR